MMMEGNMMNEKRFKIVDEQFISYYGGTGHKISNEECGFWLWHNKIESQEVCDKLNSILDEKEQLKEEIKDFQTLLADKENELLKPIIRQIEEAYNNERTQIGRNVLKQLLEAIQ